MNCVTPKNLKRNSIIISGDILYHNIVAPVLTLKYILNSVFDINICVTNLIDLVYGQKPREKCDIKYKI